MSTPTRVDEIANLAAQLPAEDRLRLVEKIVHDLLAAPGGNGPGPRRLWRELRGKASHPLCGEDAQAWVSRGRLESDDVGQVP